MGHSQFAWDIRQNPNVVSAFAHLWDSKPEDMLSSYDGMSIHLPPELTGKAFYN